MPPQLHNIVLKLEEISPIAGGQNQPYVMPSVHLKLQVGVAGRVHVNDGSLVGARVRGRQRQPARWGGSNTFSFKYCYGIFSDFSDFPDITVGYIDLSVVR